MAPDGVRAPSVYFMPGHQDAGTDAGTVWGATVAGVSFHTHTDAETNVLRLTPGRTAWLKLKDQH